MNCKYTSILTGAQGSIIIQLNSGSLLAEFCISEVRQLRASVGNIFQGELRNLPPSLSLKISRAVTGSALCLPFFFFPSTSVLTKFIDNS